ncbi:hypothetical protein B0H11DRAFT_2286106 [Mycena galericulata]|nr:hypothetical protein B0H11DRAFT_2286106 [Mycena galericulata]
MKKPAARDFEDILQCLLPVLEGLLPEPHNEIVMTLWFVLATWHAYAKLRLHSSSTIQCFRAVTTDLGANARRFLRTTCETYVTYKLPQETKKRARREASKKSKSTKTAGTASGKKRKAWNIATCKYHSLGDYPDAIVQIGTTDSYSTQVPVRLNSSSPESDTPTPTVATLPPPLKRKYDEVVAALGGAQDPVAKKKARRRTPNSAQSTMERLTSLGKFFMRAVSPYLDIGQAMLYGPEHHWSTPAAPDPSNTVVVPPAELDRQKCAIKAFDKLFTTSPDLLEVVKQLYLDIPENPDPWNKLVRVMRTAATSARTADTGGLKHCVNYLLPDPSKTPLVPPVLKSESKSDRGLAHPMLRYFLLPWKERVLLPPLQLTPAAPNTTTLDTPPSAPTNTSSPDTLTSTSPSSSSSDLFTAASNPPAPSGASNPPSPDAADELATSAMDALRKEFYDRLIGNRVKLEASEYPAFVYEEGSWDRLPKNNSGL